ncbi:MAG: protein translocase subunit SecD [Actinomycetota bacterium]|nr:protein translocase subunit SecD [Actinomycetota bacterium]
MRKKLIVTLVGVLVLSYGAFFAVLLTGTKPALGLDLQGGISVTQRPKDGTSYNSASLDLAVEKIRERVDSLGVAEPEILRQGDTIVVNLPGVKNQRQAEDLVQVTGQVYLRPVVGSCQVLDNSATTTTVAGGSTTTGPATSTTAAGGPSRPAGDATTTTGAPTTTGDTGSTTSTVPGESTTTTEVPLDENGFPLQLSDPTATQYLPLKGSDPAQYCPVGPAQGTGEVFSDDAAAQISNGEWAVTVSLRGGDKGQNIWDALATKCYYAETDCPTKQISIELDGTLQSVATVETPTFDQGSVQISGSFSESEARNLARVLNSGSLPVQLQLESVQNVSPTLGKDSLRAAWISGLVGVGLVLIFMVLYYRMLGFIVIAGLTVSGSILWSIISILSRTQGLALSLSGIAGIIVSVGVTVDSYVVFFERLKDEVRSGKTLRNSAQRGFSAAWRTIVIADLVSLLGALVLWYLTVGAVRGFAFFLGLSTACDMFVAYFFTRPTVLLLARTRWMERRKVMGIEVSTTGGVA